MAVVHNCAARAHRVLLGMPQGIKGTLGYPSGHPGVLWCVFMRSKIDEMAIVPVKIANCW